MQAIILIVEIKINIINAKFFIFTESLYVFTALFSASFPISINVFWSLSSDFS